ncbi:Hypothetical protein SCLAV_3798 [Streptomyces clavuligerus]|uniref:Uncharacterized protein n=1 Tax=Streptomyces clavuligerus TaxID=1901 RepID=B5GT02_STRCL|nr:hypothetical protein SSCG_02476 [Streptomyces clavuligerus]EFG08870.1 Hypothetical protein SCLAV_3798 [Streptomyces clavuligerus]
MDPYRPVRVNGTGSPAPVPFGMLESVMQRGQGDRRERTHCLLLARDR